MIALKVEKSKYYSRNVIRGTGGIDGCYPVFASHTQFFLHGTVISKEIAVLFY